MRAIMSVILAIVLSVASATAGIRHYCDYQGNVRQVVDAQGNVLEQNDYYPYGGLFGESASHQSYKYSGKELETMNGLNTYDFHARPYYYPVLQFHSPDIFQEKNYDISPYLYCVDNPLLFVDPNGMDTIGVNRRGNIYEVHKGGDNIINVIDPLPEVIISATKKIKNNTTIVNTAATLAVFVLTADDIIGFGVIDDPAIPIIVGLIGIYNNCNQLDSIYNINISISDNPPLYEAEHRKNRTKKNWDKHTNRRSGIDYGTNRNDKRGDRNKKYIKPENPNMRKRKY